MNRLILIALALLLFTGEAYNQSFKEIYKKSIPENKFINYPYLREGDVFWSKRIYRVIDLREKMNLSLYYPKIQTFDGRKNFVDLLLDEVKAGRIPAYDPTKLSDSVLIPVTYKDVEVSLGVGSRSERITDPITGAQRDTTILTSAKRDGIKQLLLYEEWFFDKKHSKLDVRIISIAPVWVDLDETGALVHRQVFWVRFDDLRDLLSKKEVFNPNNDAQRLSFDDLFMQRRFSSYIYGESNLYDDRVISQYTIGKDGMFEAERIKRSLADFEHDLWEY